MHITGISVDDKGFTATRCGSIGTLRAIVYISNYAQVSMISKGELRVKGDIAEDYLPYSLTN